MTGDYDILDETVHIKNCGMFPLNFVSRDTNHELVTDFSPTDFRFWYDEKEKLITPLLNTTFVSETKNYQPILMSANMNNRGEWQTELACGERPYGDGKIIICNLKLVDRLATNPVAKAFAQRLLSY